MKDILRQVRLAAIEHQKPFTELLKGFFNQIVEKDLSYRKAYHRQKKTLKNGFALKQKPYFLINRGKLHDR